MTERHTPAAAGSPWATASAVPARLGVVVDFDDERGLGSVRDDEGNAFGFHCTAIADGTRAIAVGTRVIFEVAPGHLGRLEGRGLRPVS